MRFRIFLLLLFCFSAYAGTCPYPSQIVIDNNRAIIPQGWITYQQSSLQAHPQLEFVMAACEYDVNWGYSKILCRYQDKSNPKSFLLIRSHFNGWPTRAGYWEVLDQKYMMCTPPSGVNDPKACPFAI